MANKAIPPPAAPATHRRALIALCLLAAALRLPGLGALPPPLNQDEASRGYDAWCLLETGADRWGARWPLFLRSFGPGDYTAALSTYLTIPFVALLGPTPTAMRLPAALLGVLTIPGLYAWLRRTIDERTALLAALLLTVSPWHVTMSRTAHEAALLPFFLVWGLAGMAAANLPPWNAGEVDAPSPPSRRRRVLIAFFSGIMLALAAWVYPATRLLVPVVLGCWFVLFALSLSHWAVGPASRRSETGETPVPQFSLGADSWSLVAVLRDRSRRAPLLVFLLATALAAAPLWITLLRAPEQLAARAKAASLFTKGYPPALLLAHVAAAYALEFSPIPLWWDCDNISGAHFPWFGRMLYVEAPFVLVGLFVLLIRARRCPRHRFLLLCLVLHPLPAAICGDWNPHPMRSLVGVLIWPAVSALGATAIDDLLRRRRRALPCSALQSISIPSRDFFPSRDREGAVRTAIEHNEPLPHGRGSEKSGRGSESVSDSRPDHPPRAARSPRIAVRFAAAALTLNVAWFLWTYVAWFPAAAADAFQEDLARAYAEIGPRGADYDFIWTTEFANQPSIYTLLFTPITPAQFAALRPKMVLSHDLSNFDVVTRMGHFFYAPYWVPNAGRSRQPVDDFQREFRTLPPGARGLAIDLPGRGPPGRVLKTLLRRNGQPGLEIRECVIPAAPIP